MRDCALSSHLAVLGLEQPYWCFNVVGMRRILSELVQPIVCRQVANLMQGSEDIYQS